MSKVRLNICKRKFEKILSRTPTEQFFVLAWVTHAIQSGNTEHARGILQFPEEAATDDLTSPYAISPWLIETMLNECLSIPKAKINKSGPNRLLDCKQFKSIQILKAALLDLENISDRLTLERVNVRQEMHRIAQRQFEWQRGFHNYASYYRSALIYSGPLTKKHFKKRIGVSLDDFVLGCFALRALFSKKPYIERNINASPIGLDEEKTNLILLAITSSSNNAVAASKKMRRNPTHISYKKSVLREHPCISFDQSIDRLMCPLPDLVAQRCTSGIFYDVVDANSSVKNETSANFESYCRTLVGSISVKGAIRKEFIYKHEKNQIHSPDIISVNSNVVDIIFECKATRMSYEARFAENPLNQAARGYQEIAKGVFQIWRFIAHCRSGSVPDCKLSDEVCGVVLTLDTWLTASFELQAKVIDYAKTMAAAKNPEIEEQDQIPVVFCPIEELEFTVQDATEESFRHAIKEASIEKYQGWALSSVHQDVCPDIKMANPYPFDGKITKLLPWWPED
ncbi:hypothetical protein [Thalassospira lucentensis]|uniref:hypothetical protein n=1 Tax=Thalassospira lucentensis TaxID=168935 RepID=UPI0003B4B61E|nr:hypothetical protein [Thalassospira lucentensis]RCK20340.1 hypothetical protein TH1_20075 [Thalassospira lucentensis MCCC 1A00383 = DSM 14000]